MGIVDYMMTFENVGKKPITRAQMNEFVDIWSRLDPQANGFIPIRGLRTLLTMLGEPLGMDRREHNRHATNAYHHLMIFDRRIVNDSSS